MTRHILFLSSIALLLATMPACTPSSGADGGTEDGGAPIHDDAGSERDAGSEDGGSPVDGGGLQDGGFVPDGGVAFTEAVPGARCAPAERVGLVEVESSFGTVYAYASMFDRPAPWLGPPILQDESCAFHDSPAFPGCECGVDEVCAFNGDCVEPQVPAAGLRLVLRAGDNAQVLSQEQGVGTVGGQVTLSGTTFSLELHGLSRVVTLVDTVIPGELTGLTGTMSGTYDAPTAVDISWEAPGTATSVYTNVPINHHAGTPTFTECAVDSSTGALHIDEAMLTPLAVETGLEFQGMEHVTFAAAQTALGCVEIRFLIRHYVSLE